MKNTIPARCVSMLLMAMPLVSTSLAARAQNAGKAKATLQIGDFESGVDGFDGALKSDKSVGKIGLVSAVVEADFGKDQWVTASKNFDKLDQDFTSLRFWIKSKDASAIAVRLVDKTGQNHQQRPGFPADGEWHLISINKFDGGGNYQSWGGADDKKWHGPAQNLSFILEKQGDKGGVARVWIDGIEATLSGDRVLPPLEIKAASVGNLFSPSEPVAIPVISQGDSVAWTVRDFWHHIVAQGNEPVKGGVATIRPQAKPQMGYFFLSLQARKGGQDIAAQDTVFAVTERADPKKMPDNPFGVMTHFGQGWDIDVMPLLARIGIGSIRDEHYWAQVEQKKGEYSFPKRSNIYMAEAARLGLDPLIPMTFENPLYDEGQTPYTPQGDDAYGRYGVAIARQYGKQVKWLEVWNEYNGSWCKGPAATDRPKYYTQMLQHAYERIKEARPDVQVLGCAAVIIPMPYLEAIFQHGGLKYMDGVVIHPYRGTPEGVDEEIAALHALIRKYNNGRDKPVWPTEIGHYDDSEYDWEKGRNYYEKGRHNIAQYLVRQNVLMLSAGIEKSFWYLGRDYSEQGFKTMGLLRGPKDTLGRYAPAPAYPAYANLIHQLYGATYVKREAKDDATRVYTFKRGKEEIRVCWATQPSHIAINTSTPVTVVDIMGGEETLRPAGGQVYLNLNEDPVYVKGLTTGAINNGHFDMAGAQNVDVLDEVGFDYTIDNTGLKTPLTGFLEVEGKRYAVAGKPNAPQVGRVVIPGQNTRQPQGHEYSYRLILNGQVAGKGSVTANVIDPISSREAIQMEGDRSLVLHLQNSSIRKDYALSSLAWKIGDRGGEHNFNTILPASKGLALTLPVDALPPYRSYPARIEATLAGRSSFVQTIPVSNNPCPKQTVKVDGDLSDWKGISIDLGAYGQAGGAAPLGGEARIAWDDRNFYVGARLQDKSFAPNFSSSEPLRSNSFAFALARARGDSALAGWSEFAAGLSDSGPRLVNTLSTGTNQTGAVPGSSVVIKREGSDIVYEIAIPWTSLQPMMPADGAIRLSLLANHNDGKGGIGWIEWGNGIRMGKTPEGFRLCRLESASDVQPVVVAKSVVEAIPSPQTRFAMERNLTDSVEQYATDQGSNNWFYGFYAGDGKGQGDGTGTSGPYTDDDFQPMKSVVTMWGQNWSGPLQYMSIDQGGGHPGAGENGPVWAVRRWKSDLSGTIRIKGSIDHDSQGDGVGGRILVDGVQVYETLVGGKNPDSASFDFTVPVKIGSLVDFAITPGPADDISYDHTGFKARISVLKAKN